MNNYVQVTWKDGFYREFHFTNPNNACKFASKLQRAKSTTVVLLKVSGQTWQKLK